MRSIKEKKIWLFDLDGTLTDSGPGIMKGFEYTIKKMGGEVTDRRQLRRFIGPPLEESFGQILGYSPEDTKKAITLYRDFYFNHGGAMDNTVYPGIEEVLDTLKKQGKTLLVATTKNERGANLVLNHFGLNKYFDFISAANGSDRQTKTVVIRYALDQIGCNDKDSCIMVGDRHYDIESANELGIDSIGAVWGYGDREELEKAGATYLLSEPLDILKNI